jgi:hypothetical protein
MSGYINVIRFKTGEDVISFTEEKEETIKLVHPLSIYINFNTKTEEQELVLSFWLPVNLLKTNSAEIPRSEIMLILEPRQEFKEYYLNFLNTYNIETKSNKKDKEKIKAMLESLDAKVLKQIH